MLRKIGHSFLFSRIEVLLIGTGVSGLLNQAVKNIFEVPHSYQISFSFKACAVTFLLFALIYGFGITSVFIGFH